VFCKISALPYIFFLVAATAAAQVPGLQQNTVPGRQQQRPDLATILDRMERAAETNRQNYRAYVITRKYRFYGGGEEKPSSEVTAAISFVPPRSKEFEITGSKGSSRGEGVVRHILETEQKDAKSGAAAGAVSRSNYDFTLVGEDSLGGHPCYVLGLNPKRKEKDLLVGRAWVDQNTYLVRRVQGQMAKLPSWWLKSLLVTMDLGDLGGMWLPTHTRADAEVRIFGPHTMQEHALNIRTDSTVAAARYVHRNRRFRNPATELGTIEH
jgi:hypothetical protein